MVGDLVLLPFAAFLIARSHRSAVPVAAGGWRTWQTALGLATLSTAATTGYSLSFGSYHGVWSLPHTLFIWLLAYVLIGYLITAFPLAWHRRASPPGLSYAGVVSAVVAHTLIKATVG